MALTNWTALTQALPAWLDCATADISSVLAEIVDHGERRIFRELRTPDMETSLSVNISGGNATIPSNFLELKYAYIDGSPVQYLSLVPVSYIYDRYPTRSSGGKPVIMARDGANFIFGPSPDSDYVLKGSYFSSPSSIGAGTNNALLAKHPDLYLYSCLLETEPIIGRDARMPLWESKYRMVKESIQSESSRSRLSGNMQIRPA